MTVTASFNRDFLGGAAHAVVKRAESGHRLLSNCTLILAYSLITHAVTGEKLH